MVEQEANFLAALLTTGRWVIFRDELGLRTAEGRLLIEAEPVG